MDSDVAFELAVKIDEIAPNLRPPVSNYLLKNDDLTVMVVVSLSLIFRF